MTRAVEEIGNAPRGKNINDSPESLQKIVGRIRRLRDDAHEAAVLTGQMEGKSENTLSLLKRFENTLDEKGLFVKKLYDRLSQYLGR